MKNRFSLPLVVAVFAIAGCGRNESASTAAATSAPAAATPKMTADGYRKLDWMEMMPKQDIAVLKEPAPINHSGTMRAKQIGTFNTVAGLDGVKVELPGYIVPLETDDKGNLTEFFLVPFYGACIHVPPPPPNQIVYAKFAHGIEPPAIWDPYSLKGVLRARRVTNDTAGSAYTMDDATLTPYQG